MTLGALSSSFLTQASAAGAAPPLWRLSLSLVLDLVLDFSLVFPDGSVGGGGGDGDGAG
jgi:hypothetical protein